MKKSSSFLTIVTAILIVIPATRVFSQTNSIIGAIEVIGRSELGGVTVWVDSIHVTQTYSTGNYRIDVPAGTYTVYAWAENCLARTVATVTIADRDVLGVDGVLFAGDLYPDGIIDLHDLRFILDHYLETPDSSVWNEDCDILTDQVIDSLDIDLLSSHWKEAADSRLPDWPDEPLVVIAPDASTIWNIGQSDLAVRWTSNYLQGDVSIDLYRWGVKVVTITESTDNDGEFIFSGLPDTLGTGEGYQIYVYQSAESQDFSDDFSIEDPMMIYLPDSETTWFIGEQDVSIEWYLGFEAGDVSIFLMTYATIMDTIVAGTANDGLFDEYDVPLFLPAGGGYRVEIRTATGNVAASVNFGIRQMLTVYDPNSTSVWRPETGGHVQWWNRAGLTSPVSVYLYKGEEQRYTIVEGLPSVQPWYLWSVPADIESGGDYRVMARYEDLPQIFDFSDYFDIRPVFKVTRPSSYTYWYKEQKGIAIEWEDAGLEGNVSITLYKGLSAVRVITGATENDGLYVDYDFIVPATFSPGDDFSVRVFYSADINDFSNEFEIFQAPGEANLGWNSINFTTTLLDVSMGGSDVAVTVGELGEIVWTSDGGHTWAEQESGTYQTLYAVSISGDLTATAVGMDGLILQTVDGGQNWERRRPGIAKSLTDVSQPDANTAIAVGEDGMVLRSSDGGASWEVLPSGVQGKLYAVHFIDNNNGWAGGSGGTMIRTWNGGDSWSAMDIASDNAVRDIDFLDSEVGAITRFRPSSDWPGFSRSVNVTRDGGSSWPYGWLLPGDYSSHSAVAIANSSVINVVLAGELNSFMYRSTDGGETWFREPDEMFDALFGIDYFPGGTGFTVGSSGVVLRTENSGSSWLPSTPGITDIMGIDHVDPDTAICVGYHGLIMRTTNGGENWTLVDGGMTSDMLSVSFSQDGRGIASGKERTIAWTSDYGQSWMTTSPSLAPSTVYDAEIVDDPNAVAVGDNGRIVKTSDGGASWVIVASGTSATLRAVSFIDISTGTVVGLAGTILRTSDGGVTWIPGSSGTTEDLFDVEFISAWNGMAVGSSGTILRTSDGGATWTSLSSGTSVSLTSVDYAYPNGVTVIGDDGTILRTNNNGDSWYIQEGGTTRGLRGVSYGGYMEGIIVGLEGTILQTTSGGQ